jgi:hypothetical protein
MSTLELTNNTGFFPRQKRSEREKTEQFFKDCCEVGMTLADSNDIVRTGTGVRSSKREKIVCYNLFDDIVDKGEVEKTLDPVGMFNTTEFPATYKNYPLLNPNINLLTGEERKRIFNPQVTVINADAITLKLEERKEQFFSWYAQKLQQTAVDEKKLEQDLQKFNRFINYSWKDLRERMGTQTLQYLYHTQDLKEEFSRGFKDVLICGEEIYVIEIYGGMPRLRKANPKNISTIRSGGSWKIEDSDIIVEDSYISIGEVLDRYYDYLSDKDIKDIEDGYSLTGGTTSGGRFLRPELTLPSISGVEYVDLTNMQGADMNKWIDHLNGAYDTEGNVRVTRVVWAGMRKIKVIYRLDEDGELVKDVMPEQYKPNKQLGEQVKEEWIKEWYECTKIGAGTYVKMGPCEVQMRHLDNLSISTPGIIGSVYQTGDSQGKGIIGLGKEWQYLWNTFMYRTKLAFSKDYGKVGFLPLHLIGENFGVEKSMYWMTQLGILPIDGFNQGNEGYAKGKLGGAMSGMPTQMDLSNAQQIAGNIQMLSFIKQEVDNLTGITPQRRGAIDNRETVGGIERSVMQSSHITEEWFSIHDNTKVRALRALLEAAKIAYYGQSFVKEYIMDDGTKGMLEFDYNVYKEACYGVDVTNASDDMQTLQYIKSLGERYLQASGSFAMAAEIARTKDAASIVRKLQDHEEMIQQQQQQQAEADREAQMQMAQQMQEMEMMKIQIEQEEKALDRELKQYEIDANNSTKIQIAEINTYIGAEDQDRNADGIPDTMQIADMAIKERESYSKEFTQAREQNRKDRELDVKKEVENKKLDLEKRKLELEDKKLEVAKKLQKQKDDSAMAREKIKARTAIRNKTSGEK